MVFLRNGLISIIAANQHSELNNIQNLVAASATSLMSALPTAEPIIKEVIEQSVWAGVLLYVLMFVLKSKESGEIRSKDALIAQTEAYSQLSASFENMTGSIDQLTREIQSLKITVEVGNKRTTCADKIEPRLSTLITSVQNIGTEVKIMESHIIK